MKGNGKLKTFVNGVVTFGERHQREANLGLVIAGIILTGAAAARAGYKMKQVIDESKRKAAELDEKLEIEEITEEEYEEKKKEISKETVKDTVITTLPAVASGATTVVLAVAGYNNVSKRLAALSAAYNIGEKNLIEYQDKIKEMFGEKKAQAVTDEIAADKVKKNPPAKDVILNLGRGTTLCYDPKSGRYFYSSPENVKKAVNKINSRLNDEYYISLNEFYDELGLPDVELGEELGFNVDDGLIDVDHIFSVTKTEDDQPALVLTYDISYRYAEHRGKMFG